MNLRSDDKEEDNDLFPRSFVQLNLVPQFCILALNSLDSLLAPLDSLLAPQLPSVFAC